MSDQNAALFDKLDGFYVTKSEHDWLERRFSNMTEKEKILFQGAMELEKPQEIGHVMRIASQLDCYDLFYGAGDEAALGKFVMESIECSSDAARPFLNVLHLMRGQVFDFGGLAWFTMGGAASHDIQDGVLDPAAPDFEHRYWLMRRMRSMFRVKGVSWWAEEMPSQAEYQEALANLERVNWTVDCVLTHCAPSGVVQKINPSYGTDELTDFLEMVSQRCKFAYWFFGHYHENRIIDQKYILQWEKISELSF